MSAFRKIVNLAALCISISPCAHAQMLEAKPNWPIFTDLRVYPATDLEWRMTTPVCKRYLEIAHNGDKNNALSVDQLLVYKHGYLVDQYNRPGVYSSDQPHVMMSASKPVTATILDAAIQMKLSHAGKPVTYDTRLTDFYPYGNRGNRGFGANDKQWYEAITLRHLVRMQSGFKWNESYNNPLGDFMSALYVDGIKDIVQASLNVPMELPPGTKFNYSGGNANILQGIIRMLGKENFNLDDGNATANRILFSRVGIQGAFFETDAKGNSIGSTYLYLKPHAMARLGHLYLNKGYWRAIGYPQSSAEPPAVKILTDEFVRDMQTLNSAVDRAEISDEYLEYIKEEGTPSNAITWLNQNIFDRNGVLRYAKEFPAAPSDLYFLAGHNGQIIAVLPSQEIVLVMTGNNRSYWDKVEKLTGYTAACFSNLDMAPDLKQLKTTQPLPERDADAPTLKKRLDDFTELFTMVTPAMKLLTSPVPSGAVAKELCSCMSISLLTSDVDKAIQYCPSDAPSLLQQGYHIDFKVDRVKKSGDVTVTSLTGAYVRRAVYTGQYGCRLAPYHK